MEQKDRRDYTMLEKYLDSNFSNISEKISDLKNQDKDHYEELKTQISNMNTEINFYNKNFTEHMEDEFPHKKCKENSEKIDEIKKTLDEYLRGVNDKQQYNKGLKKGVYLSATTLKYLFWGIAGTVGSIFTFWDKIKGFLNVQ